MLKTTRLDPNRIKIDSDLDVVLFADEDVPINRASIQEIATILEIDTTMQSLNKLDFFGDYPAKLHRSVLTPDFYKGLGIPVIDTVSDAGIASPGC